MGLLVTLGLSFGTAIFVLAIAIRNFADDTGIGRKMSTVNNCNLLQEDLNRIIRWPEDNNMKLHENKFELACYRAPASKSLAEELPL